MLYYISKRHRAWHLSHISYRFQFYHSENTQSQLLFTEGKQWPLSRKKTSLSIVELMVWKTVMLILNVIPVYDKAGLNIYLNML